MDMFNKPLTLLGCVLCVAMGLAADLLPLDVCRERAAQGDAEAQWQLGQRYEQGDGVRKDKLKAVANYRKAAEKNHREACLHLAELYEAGRIVGKDSVLAAQYRAQAKGENREEAAAQAQEDRKRAKFDPIENALDYVIGRNGKPRDAKSGIRLLYQEAKNKPEAQRVFVMCWERGILDDGLSTIDDKEWQLILPWFKDQFTKGRRRGGLVLGNEAFRKKQYAEAIRYWTTSGEAGCARAWFKLGNFYFFTDEINGGGPEKLHSDSKAKEAYENCLKTDASWEDAQVRMGFLCVFGDKKCRDYPRAKKIFFELMKKEPDNSYYIQWYGIAGRRNVWRHFFSQWSEERIRDLKKREGHLSTFEEMEWRRIQAAFAKCRREEKMFMEYVLRAANMGNEDAKKDYDEWKAATE